MNRRELIALGLGSLLAACRQLRDTLTPEQRTAADAAEAAEPLGPIEKRLSIYNWSDYVAPDTISNFEKEFGVKVTYDVYESNEEMLAKLLTGATGYDLVFPSSYAVSVLKAVGIASPIHRQYLTNWGNIAPLFLNPPFDPGNAHTVPWQWGVTGIAFRSDKVDAPDSWAVLQDARYRGKMTQMDDGRECHRLVASLSRTQPQFGRFGRARSCEARCDRGQEEPQGIYLGARQRAAHLRGRVDRAVVERRCHAGESRAAEYRVCRAERRLHHLGGFARDPAIGPS